MCENLRRSVVWDTQATPFGTNNHSMVKVTSITCIPHSDIWSEKRLNLLTTSARIYAFSCCHTIGGLTICIQKPVLPSKVVTECRRVHDAGTVQQLTWRSRERRRSRTASGPWSAPSPSCRAGAPPCPPRSYSTASLCTADSCGHAARENIKTAASSMLLTKPTFLLTSSKFSRNWWRNCLFYLFILFIW